MDFNDAVRYKPESLFVFYEGQDDDYYYPRLQRYAGRDIEAIKCNGKAKVIAVYKLLLSKSEYAKYHKGFFVDKDFDLNTETFFSDFFVTSGYSIENYYMSDQCMESLLRQKFGFHSGDGNLATVMSNYRSVRQRYFEAIFLFNVWYCAIKRKYGRLEGITLSQDMPKGFVKIDFHAGDVQSQYTMTEIVSTFANAANYPLTPTELAVAETYILSDMRMNLRGKYLLDFLNRYINYLMDVFRTNPAYSTHKRTINIQYNNVMSILSSFSDTEQRLIDYIARVTA